MILYFVSISTIHNYKLSYSAPLKSQVGGKIIVNVKVKLKQNKLTQLTRGHSLIGKTAILHIVISGSSPDVSIYYLK